jgi:hypothetical protein
VSSTIRQLSLIAVVVTLFVVLLGVELPAALAQAGSISITTDKSQYQPGDSIQVCYMVAAPGPFTITDQQADGSSQVFFSGVDDGTGGCLGGTVTPPAGTECLSITDRDGSGGSAQTCFQVLGQGSQPPTRQQCGMVSALNGQVTSSGAAQSEDCFYQAYQACSPATLEYNDHRVDSGTRYTFSLQSSDSSCPITESVQRYTLPMPPGSPELSTCADLIQNQFGLFFRSCQRGTTVNVPSAVVPQPSNVPTASIPFTVLTTVTLWLDNDRGERPGTSIVAADGTWQAQLTIPSTVANEQATTRRRERPSRRTDAETSW